MLVRVCEERLDQAAEGTRAACVLVDADHVEVDEVVVAGFLCAAGFPVEVGDGLKAFEGLGVRRGFLGRHEVACHLGVRLVLDGSPTYAVQVAFQVGAGAGGKVGRGIAGGVGRAVRELQAHDLARKLELALVVDVFAQSVKGGARPVLLHEAFSHHVRKLLDCLDVFCARRNESFDLHVLAPVRLVGFPPEAPYHHSLCNLWAFDAPVLREDDDSIRFSDFSNAGDMFAKSDRQNYSKRRSHARASA